MTGSPVLLLVHGWGFDPDFWAPMRAHLGDADVFCADLAFRSGGPARFPALPEGRPVVAVGHSLGLLWLLHHRPLNWAALVSVNGFPRFTKAPDWPDGTPPRLLDRMITRLETDVLGVTADFLGRCGAYLPMPCTLNPANLHDGLAALRDWDARDCASSVTLALAGETDPIVSSGLSRRAFPAAVMHPGGHLLPLEAPEWCARHCLSVMEAVRE